MWFWISGWFLVTLAAVGNALVIYLIFTVPRLQSSANWFVLSLALADLFAALAFFPPLFGANFLYTMDTSHAGLFFKISFTLMYCSNTNLFAMTLDRYFAISRPLHYMTLMSKQATWGLVIVAWITPFLLFSLPAAFTYQNNPSYTLFVEYFRVAIFQISPSVVFVGVTLHLLYLSYKLERETRKIVAQVRFNHASRDVSVPGHPARQNKNLKYSTIMIVLIITAFNITYLGGNYRCICLLTELCRFEGLVKKIIYLALIANAAVNPIVYAFVKRDMQNELRNIFRLQGV